MPHQQLRHHHGNDGVLPGREPTDLVEEGAASFQRQLVMGDLASEYDNEIRVWLEELEIELEPEVPGNAA